MNRQEIFKAKKYTSCKTTMFKSAWPLPREKYTEKSKDKSPEIDLCMLGAIYWLIIRGGMGRREVCSMDCRQELDL